MKRFSLLFFGLLAAVLTLVTACPGGPERTQDTNSDPAWRLVWSESFDMSDGLYSHPSWTYVDWFSGTNISLFVTNGTLFMRAGMTNAGGLVYNSAIPYESIQIKCKFRYWTNVNHAYFAIELKADDNLAVPDGASNYRIVLSYGDTICISTNANRPDLTNIPFAFTTNDFYYLEGRSISNMLSVSIYDSGRVLLTNLTAWDNLQLYQTGKLSFFNFGYIFIDDFTIEAWY